MSIANNMAARNYNNDLLTGINQLKEKREAVTSQIEEEQATYNKLENELQAVTERLSKSKTRLEHLQESKEAYSMTITETELVCK